jgi:putative hydrolase of the HAD superfamily
MLDSNPFSSRRIQVVFFDAAGTLFTVKGSVGEIYARIARAHGKDVAVADLNAGFRRCFATTPSMAFPGAPPEQIPELERAWWRALVRQVFAPLGTFPQFSAYFDALFACFARAETWQLYPETVETLTALKASGLQLGVISNFDSRLFGLLEGLGIASLFDSVVISTQVGAAKPEREIFLQALASLHVHPDEALHVGDSYEADIIGARNAGLTAVLVDRGGKHKGAGEDLQVGSLRELVAMVDQV